jgi:hypothetical protein
MKRAVLVDTRSGPGFGGDADSNADAAGKRDMAPAVDRGAGRVPDDMERIFGKAERAPPKKPGGVSPIIGGSARSSGGRRRRLGGGRMAALSPALSVVGIVGALTLAIGVMRHDASSLSPGQARDPIPQRVSGAPEAAPPAAIAPATSRSAAQTIIPSRPIAIGAGAAPVLRSAPQRAALSDGAEEGIRGQRATSAAVAASEMASIEESPEVASPPEEAGPAPRARPSFPCRYARTRVERMICARPRLAEWDRRMAEEYFSTWDDVGPRGREELSRSRERFLEERERCDTAGCVEEIYRDRIDEIRDTEEE